LTAGERVEVLPAGLGLGLQLHTFLKQRGLFLRVFMKLGNDREEKQRERERELTGL
jgi:hypothetical protein